MEVVQRSISGIEPYGKNAKIHPEKQVQKIEQLLQFKFELIGPYDRVGTLTTQTGCGEKAVQHGKKWRYLTVLECERMQGFPDGWTKAVGASGAYFALGNAVNCGMSRYLFQDYLPRVWTTI